MVLDDGRHGIEVGFDSTILIFLLCTIEVPDALAVWSLGVIITQVTTGKRLASKLFNIGVGILAGALAAVVLDLFRGEELGTPRELVAVATRRRLLLRHRLRPLRGLRRHRGGHTGAVAAASARDRVRRRLLRAVRHVGLPGRDRATGRLRGGCSAFSRYRW